MDAEEDELSLLTALLEENESALDCNSQESHNLTEDDGKPDAFDELFDADGDGESYTEEADDDEAEKTQDQKENLATLFGDMGDLSDEEETPTLHSAKNRVLPAPAPSQGKTNQELQDELKKLQEQMKSLQEQLKMATIKQPISPARPHKPPDKSPRPPLKEKKVQRIQESTCFSAELDVPALPKPKRVARTPQVSPAEPKNSLSWMTSTPSQPLQMTPGNKPSGMTRDLGAGTPKSSEKTAEPVSMEAFSGLRLRRPRVSSMEMNKKMTGRKLIRLSQLKEKMASEKLEDIDWVTFGVILKKVTPQSCNSGKTFSIWRLNDLRDLTRYVSLFLFGEVHKELWKTEQGTVIGLLNANPMKPKDGSEEVCLSIDHPQKVLIMGEALDLGTCKAKKKNGEPCTQTVNLKDCEYCQYHVQAQYKKLSAKRADLQSTFSGGRIPKKFARKGIGLRERLCQDGFYYGGVSSASYAASVAAAGAPKKKIQTTLTNLVMKGTDLIIQETQQKLGIAQKSLSCSEEFRELMDLPTFGARNLKQHLAKAKSSGIMGSPKPAFQSISASALLKQQKQHMLEMRKKKSEEITKRFLQSSSEVSSPAMPSSSGQPPSQSPPTGAEFPGLQGTPGIQAPKLGRGISEGDDVLSFDESPPPKPKLSALAEAKKLAAITKLKAKGQILSKTDPNSIKKKQNDPQDVLEVKKRVEKNTTLSPEAEDELEPARKKRREQLAYLESEEFQKILKAKSKHTGILKEAEAELQELYFEPLVKKEQMEEKMRNIKEVKCRVVTCKTCAYTHFKPLETCISEQHDYHWHDALKRFFKCPCGSRCISLDRLPRKHCSNCGLFKWERDGMLKEKTGPKIGGETLLPRGEEHAKFLNSLK
ncbi:minichromosome maintenance 10 replication initiation factor [Phyllostomus discolor]|uniref:Protein MCM10 homolog n=1 Tax=Phyllostomus discolor TaxID=89673 RepID=A0A6J2L8V9_9CHIR|nr:protein MCM10 homolog [Phyllostomus discolor]XP_035880779.1 protein MCM10 homolog [Phyllostomus discolor]KAF6131401.1 minichromosome maintenance 10 replication initiation factor [Phyllostomus discolor]